jgi:RHS repeat-associated protein
MVALNENFAFENPALGSKNRVGNFFGQEAKSRPANRLSGQWPRRENGHDYDETASGMFFYGFRYYDATTGRWLSRDPIGERGGLNIYGMLGNDAVNQWDLLGLSKSIESLADQLQKQIEQLRKNDLRELFLKTQKCILDGLADGKCCVSAEENSKWLDAVVEDFMRPLLDALEGNPPAHWEETFNNLDEAEKVLENETAFHRWAFELVAARDMALAHINFDLRNSIEINKAGTDEDWECIGDVVSDCEKEFFKWYERWSGKAVGIFDSTFDVAKLRDEMRDDVKKNQR